MIIYNEVVNFLMMIFLLWMISQLVNLVSFSILSVFHFCDTMMIYVDRTIPRYIRIMLSRRHIMT